MISTKLSLSLWIGCFSMTLLGQNNKINNVNLQSSYLYEIAGGDLSDRYGNNAKFEFKVEYLASSKWAVYTKTGIRINQNVKEDVLEPIRTENGFVIGANGFYADVFGRKRGFDVGLGIDKLFPFKKHFFRAGLSTAYMAHWVNFVDDSQSLPQITGLTGQYFDHFASGFGVEQNIQFQYQIQGNRAALLIGLQLGQFFTKEHRYQLINAPERRVDLYHGIKLTYLLPLITFAKEETVFY